MAGPHVFHSATQDRGRRWRRCVTRAGAAGAVPSGADKLGAGQAVTVPKVITGEWCWIHLGACLIRWRRRVTRWRRGRRWRRWVITRAGAAGAVPSEADKLGAVQLVHVPNFITGSKVVTGACQEQRQPLRRARDGVAALRPLALLTGRRDVRDEGSADNGGGDTDEDERTGTQSTLLHLHSLR